jgi:hypothetical protein
MFVPSEYRAPAKVLEAYERGFRDGKFDVIAGCHVPAPEPGQLPAEAYRAGYYAGRAVWRRL